MADKNKTDEAELNVESLFKKEVKFNATPAHLAVFVFFVVCCGLYCI